MTKANENSITMQKPSRWKTLWDWFVALDQGMHYDPQEQTYAKLHKLSKEVEVLNSRLDKVENGRMMSLK